MPCDRIAYEDVVHKLLWEWRERRKFITRVSSAVVLSGQLQNPVGLNELHAPGLVQQDEEELLLLHSIHRG